MNGAPSEPPSPTPPAVLYLSGPGRSGSTLIERIIGAEDGFVNVGELVSIFDFGVLHNERCGCGDHFDECVFWTKVGQAAFGGWSREHAETVVAAREAWRGSRYSSASQILLGRRQDDLAPYVDAFDRIYAAIGEVSGARFVLDASKEPIHGLVLTTMSALDIRPIQLVRDPHGVTYSFTKGGVVRPHASEGPGAEMEQYSAARASVMWARANFGAAVLRRRNAQSAMIRYEDFVAAPRPTLQAALAAVGAGRVPFAGLDSSSPVLGPSHAIGGNPNRFQSGPVHIRPDDAWREKMPAKDRRTVTVLTGALNRGLGRGVQATAAAPSGPAPDFVIIGAQKSGSSALMRNVAEHPAVYLPKDETRYFRDPWFRFEDPAVLRTAVAPAPAGVARRGIKCPALLALPQSPERIRDELGLVDLIAVLRDPVSRAVSAYYWYMQWGFIPVAPAEDGLRALLDGSLQRTHPRGAEILEYGLYGKQVQRFLEVFPREKLHVLLSDDLRADVARATADVFRFLGVDADVPLTAAGRSVNTGVYSPFRLRFLSLRHRWIMRPYPGYEGIYQQPPTNPVGWFVNRAVAAIDRLVLARLTDNKQPPVSAQVRELLAAYYREDRALLSTTLGLDVSAWTHSATPLTGPPAAESRTDRGPT